MTCISLESILLQYILNITFLQYYYILILPLFFDKVIYIESILNLHQPSLFPPNQALPCVNSKDKGSVKNCLAIALLTLRTTTHTHTPTSPPPSQPSREMCRALPVPDVVPLLGHFETSFLGLSGSPDVSWTHGVPDTLPSPDWLKCMERTQSGECAFLCQWSQAQRDAPELRRVKSRPHGFQSTEPSQVAAAPRIRFSSRRFWTVRTITQSSAVSL